MKETTDKQEALAAVQAPYALENIIDDAKRITGKDLSDGKWHEFEPRYDSRQSFYNKASVGLYHGHILALKSYDENICAYDFNTGKAYNLYPYDTEGISNTTVRHLREFAKRVFPDEMIPGESKKDLLKMLNSFEKYEQKEQSKPSLSSVLGKAEKASQEHNGKAHTSRNKDELEK